ncbi:hypothetical protein GCM10029992_12100 [Glycomyces albus]
MLAPHVPVAADLDLQLGRQRVDDRDSDAVEAAGDRVALRVELAAGVEHRQRDLDARLLQLRVGVDGESAAVVGDADAAVGQEGDRDVGAVPGHGLIDRVVDDLLQEVVQAALAGRADVHARALPDRLETLEDRQR